MVCARMIDLKSLFYHSSPPQFCVTLAFPLHQQTILAQVKPQLTLKMPQKRDPQLDNATWMFIDASDALKMTIRWLCLLKNLLATRQRPHIATKSLVPSKKLNNKHTTSLFSSSKPSASISSIP